MLIEELDLTTRQINALHKKKITSRESLVRYIPNKYHDYSNLKNISMVQVNQDICIKGIIENVSTKKSNGKIILKAKVCQLQTKTNLYVNWIGISHMYKTYKEWVGKEVLVGGKLQYSDEYNIFSMMNPFLFTKDIEDGKKVYKENRNIKNISSESFEQIMSKAVYTYHEIDPVPKELLERFKIMEVNEAIMQLHYPKSVELIEKARQRMIFDDLLYFASKLESNARNLSKGSIYNIKTIKNFNNMIKNLGYDLTIDQQKTVQRLISEMKEGKRIDALLQGDVGCGKTIVAFLVMMTMADSGYQSVLLAPLQIVAKQHFEEISSIAIKYGYRAAYLDSSIKTSEKKKIYKGIKEGEYQFIIGTHSVFAKDIEYKNLALTITDEEHKFGVIQRTKLTEKSNVGMHTISMSATPIPRTLSNILFDNGIKEICNIKSMPNGRKAIQTQIYDNEKGILKFAEKQINEGRQCYVVCSLIEKADEESVMSKVLSAEETYETYKRYFEPKGVRAALVSGKTTSAESEEIFDKFHKNEYQILISTTVIEVGVNVPNATLIVINNAERFGLSTLHQLRGRVGRGKYQSYCILKSVQHENPRLKIMEETTDGFKIAEEDYKLRGAGDVIGTDQSGNNKYINLVADYPNLFKKIKEIAIELVDNGISEKIIEKQECI